MGGLSHAYSSGAINALKLATLQEYKKLNEYIIEIPYSIFDNVVYYLNKKGIVISDKQFLDNVFICLNLDEDTLNEFINDYPNINITLTK